MASQISTIEALTRQRLIEITASFWTSQELVDIISAGVRDLWRDIVDLKQEHYLTINNTDVYYGASASELSGVPTDVHKVYMIEPRDLSANGTNHGIVIRPMDYNARDFQLARSLDAIEPANATFYYCIMG